MSARLARSLTVAFFLSTAMTSSAYSIDSPSYTKSQIVALSYGGDIRLYKMAYVVYEKANAERIARDNPVYKSDSEAAKTFVQQRVRDARDYVNGDSFRGGWIEAFAKSAVPAIGAASAGPEFFVVPRAVTDKGVEAVLDVFERKGMTPSMDPQAVVNIGGSMLDAAKDKDNPDHEFAKKMVAEFLGLDPAISYDLIPAVRNQISLDKLGKMLEDIQARLASANDDDAKKQILDEMRAESASLLEIVDNALGDARGTTTKLRGRDTPEQQKNQQLATQLKNELQQVGLGFGAMSGIATLFNDPQAAAFFQKAQALVQGVSDAIQTTLKNSFSDSPMLYADVYVGVAVLLVNLFQTAQEQSAAAAIMDQLRSVSKQVEDLRREMHERLDILDFKADHYFEKSYFDIQNINLNVALVHGDLASLSRDLSTFRYEILSGLSFNWRVQLTNEEENCFGADLSGASFPLNEQQMLRCRNFFVEEANAPESMATDTGGAKDALGIAGKESIAELSALRDTLSRLDAGQTLDEITVLPSNWTSGVEDLLALFKAHSNHLGYALHSGLPGRPDLDFDKLIEAGSEIAKHTKTLALEEKDGRFVLKADLLKGLLDVYGDQARNAIYLGELKGSTFAKNGPKPTLGFVPRPPHDEGYSFFADPKSKTVDFCEGAEKSVKLGDFYDTWPDNFAKLDIDYNTSKEYATGFDRKWFSLNPTFLGLVPNSVLWASRMDFEGLRIIPCFRSVEIPVFRIGLKAFVYQFKFELEFQATSTKEGTKPFLCESGDS